MSAAKHTPGPWIHATDFGQVGSVEFGDGTVIAQTQQLPGDQRREQRNANARLIASAPDLLAAVESEYIFLADIHNEWPGRHTAEGQTKLCRLRDLICKATGREAQDVQDDYGNRNIANTQGAAS